MGDRCLEHRRVGPPTRDGIDAYLIFQSATSPYTSLREETWGIALTLVVVVLIINLGSRLVAARLQKERR